MKCKILLSLPAPVDEQGAIGVNDGGVGVRVWKNARMRGIAGESSANISGQ